MQRACRRTRLDARFLALVDSELLQLLLVRVAKTGHVYVCESAAEAVHCGCMCGRVGLFLVMRKLNERKRVGGACMDVWRW